MIYKMTHLLPIYKMILLPLFGVRDVIINESTNNEIFAIVLVTYNYGRKFIHVMKFCYMYSFGHSEETFGLRIWGKERETQK